MQTQRGVRFADRPRRVRRDLVKDHDGQWWQAIIALIDGVPVVRMEKVKSRGGAAPNPAPHLRLVGDEAN
jgi:hypothetical protein